MNQQDKILIQDLHVQAKIGVLEREQEVLQPLIFNLTLYPTVQFDQVRDDLNLAVNYAQVSEELLTFVQAKQHYLLETLAEEVAQFLLTNFAITAIVVRINKPHALAQSSVAVEIYRSKK